MLKHRFFLLLIFSVFLAQSCYTIFKHPEIATNQGTVMVWITDNCTDCHSIKEFSPEIHKALTVRDSIAPTQKITSGDLSRFHFEHYPWWYKYYQNDAINHVLNRPSAHEENSVPQRGMVGEDVEFIPTPAAPPVIVAPPATPVRPGNPVVPPSGGTLTKDNDDDKDSKKSKSSSKRPIKKR